MKNIPQLIVAVLALLLIGWIFWGAGLTMLPQKSVEVGVTSLSPKGISGGFAIPASCPSYEHTPGECAPPALNLFGENNETGESGGAITINQGGSVTIEWNATGATSCDGLNFSTGGAISGSVVVSPTTDTTYTVVCFYNPGTYSPSSLQSSVGVTVLNPDVGISASPVSVKSGNQSTVTWSATNVDSCTVTGPNGFSQTGISGSAPSGPITVQSTFILTCQNEGGELSDSAVVTLIPEFEEF
ncbi:MAG: hypothetical protein HYT93_02120 [Parcubacteria group bacterium]|nr:hypothetical protein [Parcubacteria group bacterium]